MDELIKETMEENNIKSKPHNKQKIIKKPKIFVVGCGGGGSNTINSLYNIGISDATIVAINTDAIHLETISADIKMLIGLNSNKGLGAGGSPELGKKSAELAKESFKEILNGANLIFITAGMGGGTGTGSAPVIAKVASELGAIVIAMVTTPFNVEKNRLIKARNGIRELRKYAHTVIILDNNRLLEFAPDLPIDQAFLVYDKLISETVKGLSETITQPSLINLDFADVRTIMTGGGVATMLVGEATGVDKANEVVRKAIEHPLLDVNLSGAKGCLLHVTGGPDMSLNEVNYIAKALTSDLDMESNMILGARLDPKFNGKIRCMAIMTGIEYNDANVPNFEPPIENHNKNSILDDINIPRL